MFLKFPTNSQNIPKVKPSIMNTNNTNIVRKFQTT